MEYIHTMMPLYLIPTHKHCCFSSCRNNEKTLQPEPTHGYATERRSAHLLRDILSDTESVTIGEVMEVDLISPEDQEEQHNYFTHLMNNHFVHCSLQICMKCSELIGEQNQNAH